MDPAGGPDSFEALAIGRKMDGSANRGGGRSSERVDVSRVPVDRSEQAIMHDIRHAEPDSVSIAVLAQTADKDTVDMWRCIPKIRFAIHASVHDLRVHPRARIILADFVKD